MFLHCTYINLRCAFMQIPKGKAMEQYHLERKDFIGLKFREKPVTGKTYRTHLYEIKEVWRRARSTWTDSEEHTSAAACALCPAHHRRRGACETPGLRRHPATTRSLDLEGHRASLRACRHRLFHRRGNARGNRIPAADCGPPAECKVQTLAAHDYPSSHRRSLPKPS